MNKHLLRTLFLSIMMVFGAMGAWAENWSIDFAAVGANHNDKTGVTISSTVATIGGITMGTCTVENESLDSKFVLQTGTTWLIRKANGLYQGNSGGRAMGFLGCTKGQTITIVGTGDPNPSTNATLKSHVGNTYTYTVNEDGDVKFTPARYLYFTSVAVEDPSASAVDYTVKYVDQVGNEIKESTTGSGEPGTSVSLTEAEKSSFLNEEGTVKYIYLSDDSEGKTIANDGSTVVTITFRLAETYNYTLLSNLGETFATGTGFEGETVAVGYPRYQLKNGVFYEAAVTNKQYSMPIALSVDNATATVEYTAKVNANAVFYVEGENIEGMTVSTTGNIPARASGALAGAASEDVTITTLPAGKYIFHVGIFASKTGYEGKVVNFGIGAETFAAAFNAVNLNEVASGEYTLTETTDIKFIAEGTWADAQFDYIWIERTAKTIYLNPGVWNIDGARFAAYGFKGEVNEWFDFTPAQENGIFTATVPTSYTGLILARMNGATTENNWDNKWNQTGDINFTAIADNTLFTITGWGGDNSPYETSEYVYTEPVAAGYTVDFNTQIATSAKDFAVASNWAHVSGYDAAYGSNMSYSWSETAGVDKTGALLAYRQYKYDWGQSSSGVEVYDLLITPQVKGTVSIDVKQYSGSNSYIEFYAMTDNGDGTFTRGDLIPYTKDAEAEFSQSAYVTVSINVADFARIGIRASYMYLDNFTAQEANIIPEKAITIASADPTATTGTIYWDQQADGTVLVKYTVTVKNTGDVDLTQGMDGYSVSIFNRDDNTVYVTTPVPQDLAVGATSEPFVVLASVDASVWPNSYSYHSMDLKENLKGSVLQRAQSHYKAYQSKFIFRAAESTATSSITAPEAWGTITESTTKSFEIYNDGLAPLTIKSIILPDGFTSDNAPEIPSEGLVLNGKAKVTFNVTQDAASYGTFAGNLAVEYLNYGAEETTTYTLAFSATIINANTWTADFNNTKSAIVYPAGAIAEAGINSDYDYNSGTYNYWITGRTQSSYASGNNMFITPKLHANANESLAYDVKGAYGSSYYAKVYVSTDRKNWTQVAYYTQGETEGAEAIGYSNWYTKQVTFAEAGDYYVAFSLYGTFKIDNLVGLEKVDVAHDLYIKSVTWPDASIKSGSSQSSRPNVDVISLTDETAEAYTVKYVCGETVLAEATPKALTASASSSTSFSFNWTPNVTETTVYPATKVVFEFTDGTKFETETFDLTVTNEAIFHFVKTLPTSKWNEPTDYTTPIAFGKTNTADTQTFYVYNWGSAPLTVNGISLPAGFTTDVEFPQTVVAFDESNLSASALALPITFSAEEAGTFGGDMVITYSGDQTFTLAVSGTKLDPSKFYANFDDGGWPAGSVYQNNIGSSNGGTYSAPNYYITSSSTTDNIFVTPKLTAAAGEKLLFDAKLYSSYWSEGAVKVYAATTREEVLNAEEGTTRELLFYASGEDTEANAAITTDYQTFEVPALAGDYFYGFEISGRPYVDELCGLAPVAVAHDLMLVSSDIPAEGMANYPLTATVNVLNLGLQDETEYDIFVHVGDEVKTVAGTEPITMKHKLSESTAISVPVQTAKAGTYSVFIEVKAGDYTIATDPVEVTFAEEVAVSEAIQVGTQTSTGRDYGFVDWYNNDGTATNYTDIVYPAAKIAAAGIKAGDKITSITFKGSNSAKTFKLAVTSWVGTSTGDITFGTPNKEEMAEIAVYNGDVALPANFETVLTLPEAIVWDGTSDIRVYTEAVGQGSGNWVSVQTPYDSEMTMSFNGTTKAAPLAWFTLAAEAATISGTVKDAEGAPIENATITLVSADDAGVQYSGTTDAEGAYNFNVVQANRQYLATVTAEGYADKKTNVSFADGNVVKNFTMKAPALKNIFLKPGVWAQDDARFAAYVWYEGWTEWIDFTPAMEDGIYTFTTSTPYDGLILVRLNPTTAENNWDNKWNQSSDIDFTAVADSTLFVIDGWNASEFHTEKYSAEEAPVYAKGDVNMDGDVNTSDAVLVVNVAIEKATLTDEQFALADINESNTITVADAVGIVNIALGIPVIDGTKARVFGTNDFLTLNGQQLSLNNTTSFVAFQMDVTLANGASFNGIELSQRASGLQVVTNQIGYNTWRIVAFSLNNATITGNQGNLLRIDANGEININNVEFADAAANAYELGFGDATGINEIEDGKLKIENAYNLGGQKLQKTQKGLNIINGRKVVVK